MIYGYSVTFTCPQTKEEITTSEVSIEGGCFGHYGEYDYCYCDSQHLEVKCGCGYTHDIYSY